MATPVWSKDSSPGSLRSEAAGNIIFFVTDPCSQPASQSVCDRTQNSSVMMYLICRFTTRTLQGYSSGSGLVGQGEKAGGLFTFSLLSIQLDT